MFSVLIVEDDPMVRKINEKFLDKVDGFQLVASVSSLKEAQDIVLKRKIDLILLDIFFPKGKGIDFLKWIRQNDFDCDVILITADRNTETLKECLRFGAVDYIVKPFVFKRFKEALIQFKSRDIIFKKISEAKQELIDEYFLSEDNIKDVEEKNQKGFNQYTYDKIYEYLSEIPKTNFTSQELADDLGISRITARRYLDLLEQEGKVELEMEYGKIGRPKNKYKLKKNL